MVGGLIFSVETLESCCKSDALPRSQDTLSVSLLGETPSVRGDIRGEADLPVAEALSGIGEVSLPGASRFVGEVFWPFWAVLGRPWGPGCANM